MSDESSDCWANARANARPDCRCCHGSGIHLYDHNHATICPLCCRHNLGWWLLSDGFGGYVAGQDTWCCGAGCGHKRSEPGYLLVEDGRAIRCGLCAQVSWSQADIDNRYCGCCRRFLGVVR